MIGGLIVAGAIFLSASMFMRYETSAQAASFPLLLPLVFASSALVSTEAMPRGLQHFAEHQPVSAAVDAVRALVFGGPWAGKALQTLAWSAAIAFGYLALRRYRRAV